MYAVKALLRFQLRIALVSVFQRIYRHRRIAARVYRALANRHLDDLRRDLILLMADLAEQRAHHYAVQLRRLGSTLLPEKGNWDDRLWYWLLVHCSVGFAIRWIEWVEHMDNSDLASLLSARTFWQ